MAILLDQALIAPFGALPKEPPAARIRSRPGDFRRLRGEAQAGIMLYFPGLWRSAACAAASRAIGTRKGEQET